jgi:hypothetical protein
MADINTVFILYTVSNQAVNLALLCAKDFFIFNVLVPQSTTERLNFLRRQIISRPDFCPDCYSLPTIRGIVGDLVSVPP